MNPVSAARQIADGLRVLLVDRQLEAGTDLPSVRRLAVDLGVHFSTVAEAYRALAAEGWLELRHGRGAVVLPHRMPSIKHKDWAEEFRDRVRGAVARLRSQGIPAGNIAEELIAIARGVTK